MSRRCRTTASATALKMRNVLTKMAMNDSASRLSENARTRFSTCFVRAAGRSGRAPSGSAAARVSRTRSTCPAGTMRSTRSSRPSRENTSCTVARSASTTLPPMASCSASLPSSATMRSGRARPEASTVIVSPTASPCRPASVRVIATEPGRASSSSAAARSSASSDSASRANGASANGSRPSTMSVSSNSTGSWSTASATRTPARGGPACASALTSTTGAAAMTPGVRRMRAYRRSSNPSAVATTCRLARPVTASTVSPKLASAERLASRMATNTLTPSATPSTVSSSLVRSRSRRRTSSQRSSAATISAPRARPACRSRRDRRTASPRDRRPPRPHGCASP